MKTIKAYLILILTGWRSAEIFGNPSNPIGFYIVCLKNNEVTEANCFTIKNIICWHKLGYGDLNKNPVKYWRKLPASPKEMLYLKKENIKK